MPDPHYNLPIITCPECRTSVVRRRDPGVRGFRTGYKAARAVVFIGIQALVTTLVGFASVGLIANIAYSAHAEYGGNPLAILLLRPHLLRQDEMGPELAVLSVVLFLMGVIVGVWIRSALSHLRPGWVLLAAVSLPVLFLLQHGWRYTLWMEYVGEGRPWGDRETLQRTNEILTAGGMYAASIVAGFPLARGIRSLWTSQQRARWSRRRRNRRRLRDDR